MDKTQKIAVASIIALLIIAGVMVLQKSNGNKLTQTQTTNPSTFNPEQLSTKETPSNTINQPTQTAQSQLEPLPADDKQAIDTELSNIDKDLKSTDNTINSTDLSNANLGL